VTSDSNRGGLSARKWQLRSADQWLADRRSLNSESAQMAAEFSDAVTRFFTGAVGDNAILARQVIAELGPTLSNCDQLEFDQFPQSLAYLLWHEVDRYHRTMQSLDLLFERGALPVAKPQRKIRLLEVGSGPAPASYAAVDYFTALGAWSEKQPTQFACSGSVEVQTLDRGPAWGEVIHQLSEQLLISGRAGPKRSYGAPSTFFNVDYTNLRGFNPRRLHSESRDRYRRRLLEAQWADDDLYLNAYHAPEVLDPHEAVALAARTAPPSAYDVIIVANFLTNHDMLQKLEADLETLARSLVPGGVLLTLSAPGAQYQGLWDRFSELAEKWRLDHEVDQVLQAHEDLAIHAQVAGATISALRHLASLAPEALSAADLPSSARAEVNAALAVPASTSIEHAVSKFNPYPRFQVHAFKRGHRAIPARDRNRIALRKGR
jgi:hypothetical protein